MNLTRTNCRARRHFRDDDGSRCVRRQRWTTRSAL